MKNQSRTWLRRISFAGSSSVAAVRKLRVASPERRLPIEAAARAQVVLEYRKRESIDLDEDDARRTAHIARAVPCGKLAHQGAEERVVVAGRKDGGHECIPGRKKHRADDRVRRALDRDPSRLRDEPEGDRLHEDRDQCRDGDRDPRQIGDENRTQERPHRGESDRREDAGWNVLEGDARKEPRRHDEPEHGDDERGYTAADDAVWATRPSRQETELGRVELDHSRIRLGPCVRTFATSDTPRSS